MRIKRVLWLEDEPEDYSHFRSTLARAGYLVDTVRSVSEAEHLLRKLDYTAVIFDLKVLRGYDEKWMALDHKKRCENPCFDPCLGFDLLCSLFKPDEAAVKLEPPIQIDPNKIIVFSVAGSKRNKIVSFGIPEDHIIPKSDGNLTSLPMLIRKIEAEAGKHEE